MLSKVTPSLDSRRKSGVSDVRAVQRTASLLEAMSLSGAGAIWDKVELLTSSHADDG